jgi:hypothetical protein
MQSTPKLTSASCDDGHWDIAAMTAGAMLPRWWADSAMRAGGGRHNKG